jgi:hypothetical protein
MLETVVHKAPASGPADLGPTAAPPRMEPFPLSVHYQARKGNLDSSRDPRDFLRFSLLQSYHSFINCVSALLALFIC